MTKLVWPKTFQHPSVVHPHYLNFVYPLNQNILVAHLVSSYSAYLLNQSILAYPRSLKFCIPTQSKDSSTPWFPQILHTHLTRIQNILAHPSSL
jgi:hypothetical protein